MIDLSELIMAFVVTAFGAGLTALGTGIGWLIRTTLRNSRDIDAAHKAIREINTRCQTIDADLLSK